MYLVPFLRYSALKNGVTLKAETGGTGRSRSLKMAQFDRTYMTFYWSAIVRKLIALCCTIFESFDVA